MSSKMCQTVADLRMRRSITKPVTFDLFDVRSREWAPARSSLGISVAGSRSLRFGLGTCVSDMNVRNIQQDG